MIEIQLDSRDFGKALAQFAANSKKDAETLLKDQARLFVRDVIGITPPNSNFKMDKNSGLITMYKDIGLTLKPVRYLTKKQKASPVDAAAHHRSQRNRRGRVNKNAVRAVVAYQAFKAQLLAMKKRQGRLAAGWNASAETFGTKVPAWIKRHGTMGGSASLIRTGQGPVVRMTNASVYDGDEGGAYRRVNSALKNRTRQMMKQLENFALKRSARKAGFSVI
jgi:hypothetical protein